MEPCTVGSRVLVVTTSIQSYYLFGYCFFVFFKKKAIMIITASYVILTLYFMAWIDRPPFDHLPVLSESESL